MKVVAKIRCTCGRWVRIRSNSIPSDKVSCWNCNSEIQLFWVNRSGGNAKVTKNNQTVTVYDVDIESLELP
jgi:hypothetical protein